MSDDTDRGRLPGYIERADLPSGEMGVRCTVCGNRAATLGELEHDCIYQNDLVADGGEDEGPTVDDYTAEDGWDDQNGLEQCPHCQTVFSPNGGWFDEVFDEDGTRYESIYATEPGEGPYFCGDCYPELEANQKNSEHHDLGEFAQ